MCFDEELHTDRLHLRRWQDADREPFAALNADPAVMEHFPAALSRVESDAYVDRITAGWVERGWGLWAVDIDATGTFIGYVGLSPATFDAPFTPAVEIGWRLSRAHWNQGLATEAARTVVDHTFKNLDLDEIVSFTATTNAASQRVMQKIGMRRDPTDDFDHPALAVGHRLRRHVLYRLRRPAHG